MNETRANLSSAMPIHGFLVFLGGDVPPNPSITVPPRRPCKPICQHHVYGHLDGYCAVFLFICLDTLEFLGRRDCSEICHLRTKYIAERILIVFLYGVPP